MSIPLETKQRIHEADARIDRLEKLLRTWMSYTIQAGELPAEFDDNNPLHTLIRDTNAALKPPLTLKH